MGPRAMARRPGRSCVGSTERTAACGKGGRARQGSLPAVSCSCSAARAGSWRPRGWWCRRCFPARSAGAPPSCAGRGAAVKPRPRSARAAGRRALAAPGSCPRHAGQLTACRSRSGCRGRCGWCARPPGASRCGPPRRSVWRPSPRLVSDPERGRGRGRSGPACAEGSARPAAHRAPGEQDQAGPAHRPAADVVQRVLAQRARAGAVEDEEPVQPDLNDHAVGGAVLRHPAHVEALSGSHPGRSP